MYSTGGQFWFWFDSSIGSHHQHHHIQHHQDQHYHQHHHHHQHHNQHHHKHHHQHQHHQRQNQDLNHYQRHQQNISFHFNYFFGIEKESPVHFIEGCRARPPSPGCPTKTWCTWCQIKIHPVSDINICQKSIIWTGRRKRRRATMSWQMEKPKITSLIAFPVQKMVLNLTSHKGSIQI